MPDNYLKKKEKKQGHGGTSNTSKIDSLKKGLSFLINHSKTLVGGGGAGGHAIDRLNSKEKKKLYFQNILKHWYKYKYKCM